MISIEEVEHLAKLARIGMTDGEKRELQKDLERILDYVSEIKKVSENADAVVSAHRNVMREDSEPHEARMWSEAILAQAPLREGDYVKVKKVLKEGR